MSIFVIIEEKTGIPAKAVIGSLVLALISSITLFYYNNSKGFPRQQIQIDGIEKCLRSSNQKDSAKAIQFEIMKYDIKQVVNNQTDLKEDMKEIKEGQKELTGLLIEILKNKGIALVNR